jgi:hypothetical protein
MDRSNDRIVSRFNYARMTETTTLPIITVYARPEDYPDKFVARLFDLDKPTNLAAVADTYEEIMEAIPPQMSRIARSENDDPCIVETWF